MVPLLYHGPCRMRTDLSRNTFRDAGKSICELDAQFEYGCGDFLLLRALVKMGFSGHETIQRIMSDLDVCNLPDGGFLCLHRLKKLKYTPKSCYKANLHALMFLSECWKHGIEIPSMRPLIAYFINRRLFYKSTDADALVLNVRSGWRTIDTFYPFEAMRVGLQNIVEAFCALGYGNDACLQEAWRLLEACKDAMGKVILQGTLTKSYLPKEKVGKPSKWATFYVLLAEKERDKAGMPEGKQ